MKTTIINNALSALAMMAMDVDTVEQIESAKKAIKTYKEKLNFFLGEDVANHFEYLTLKILEYKHERIYSNFS